MGNFSMLEGFTAELFSLSHTHTHKHVQEVNFCSCYSWFTFDCRLFL